MRRIPSTPSPLGESGPRSPRTTALALSAACSMLAPLYLAALLAVGGAVLLLRSHDATAHRPH